MKYEIRNLLTLPYAIRSVCANQGMNSFFFLSACRLLNADFLETSPLSIATRSSVKQQEYGTHRGNLGSVIQLVLNCLIVVFSVRSFYFAGSFY